MASRVQAPAPPSGLGQAAPSGRTRNHGELDGGPRGFRGCCAALPGSPGLSGWEGTRANRAEHGPDCLGTVLQAALWAVLLRSPGPRARPCRPRPEAGWARACLGGERRLPAGATCSVHTGPPRNQPTTCTRRGPWSQALTDRSSLAWRCANMLLKTRSGVKSPLKPPAPGTGSPGCRRGVWCVACGSRPLTGPCGHSLVEHTGGTQDTVFVTAGVRHPLGLPALSADRKTP